jgi:hypothetical protein
VLTFVHTPYTKMENQTTTITTATAVAKKSVFAPYSILIKTIPYQTGEETRWLLWHPGHHIQFHHDQTSILAVFESHIVQICLNNESTTLEHFKIQDQQTILLSTSSSHVFSFQQCGCQLMYSNMDDATPFEMQVLHSFATYEIWAVECSITNIMVVTFHPTTMQPHVFVTSLLGLGNEMNGNDWNVVVLANQAMDKTTTNQANGWHHPSLYEWKMTHQGDLICATSDDIRLWHPNQPQQPAWHVLRIDTRNVSTIRWHEATQTVIDVGLTLVVKRHGETGQVMELWPTSTTLDAQILDGTIACVETSQHWIAVACLHHHYERVDYDVLSGDFIYSKIYILSATHLTTLVNVMELYQEIQAMVFALDESMLVVEGEEMLMVWQ